MGISILSGCLTTFGCGVWLFFANFQTFTTFGFVICLTVSMGFVVSMLTFGAMMHIFGPERGFCSICLKKAPEERYDYGAEEGG